MKSNIILILFIFLILTPNSASSINYEKSESLIKEIFSIEVHHYDNNCSFSIEIKKPDSSNWLYPYVNQLYYYLNYLVYNVPDYDFKKIREYCNDKHKADSIFYGYLYSSSQFKRAFLSSILTYYGDSNLVVEGIPVRPKREPLFVSHLLKIAVRFFYPDQIENDSIKGHICVGINGLTEFKHRNYAVEAFVFSAIFTQIIHNDKFGVYKKYKSTLDNLSTFYVS